MLYGFVGSTWMVESASNPHVHSLVTAPVILDINIVHGLLGHPDTRTVTAMAAAQG